MQALPDEARRFWDDPDVRRRALEAVLRGETGAVERLDAAIEAGLRAVGLPRAAITGIRLHPEAVMWAGRKRSDCTLHFSLEVMQASILAGSPDDTVSTWVHESLHARQPYSLHYRTEYVRAAGYEEGMVEGIARGVTRELSGMHPRDGTFEYYVVAYEAFAEVANVDLQQLWRALWRSPAGQVRAVFPAVMAEMYQHAGIALDATQQMPLRCVADSIFQTARAGWVPDAVELARVWRLALP